MVFYRKYRPQTINELDSEQVRRTLSSVLSLPEVPHAFLFTGPKGLGKTSTARIVAKVVNCQKVARVPQVSKVSKAKGKNSVASDIFDTSDTLRQIEPCNQCDQCTSITNGTNLDVLEIDAASNRGIDEIRDLREKIKLTPVAAKKKVYIIDEVHMLTTEAFNALLKTLEEPPAHAMFILCTTELHKVPATILSRCFHVVFQPAVKDDIARSFSRIAAGEGLTITDEAVEEIADLADGGFRDAHKILEELTAMGDKVITKELVEKRYKVASSRNYVISFIESLQKRDAKSGLDIIQKLTEQGIDVKQFLLQLMEQIHSMLLEKAGVVQNSEFRIQNSELSMGELRELLMLLQKAHSEMKYTVLAQLPLELAIIEWSQTRIYADQNAEKNPIEHLFAPEVSSLASQERVYGAGAEQRGKQVAVPTVTRPVSNNAVTVTSMRKKLGDLTRVKALYGEEKQKPAEETGENIQDIKTVDLLHISNSELTPEWMDHLWKNIILEMKQFNHTIAGVLRGCSLVRYDKEILVIETAYKFHKQRLDDAKTMQALEQACKTLTGNSVRVEVRLRS